MNNNEPTYTVTVRPGYGVQRFTFNDKARAMKAMKALKQEMIDNDYDGTMNPDTMITLERN